MKVANDYIRRDISNYSVVAEGSHEKRHCVATTDNLPYRRNQLASVLSCCMKGETFSTPLDKDGTHILVKALL
ncbi:hypothetical protein J6590_056341 [Homalodisca vitripennis]|nr:hypothetical protein J6590_056341 [Homalodisca vitripennis]